jgi:hypothetical protein
MQEEFKEKKLEQDLKILSTHGNKRNCDGKQRYLLLMVEQPDVH